jgi:colanic acid/amylovoran biosynthesis glycosyltransferase
MTNRHSLAIITKDYPYRKGEPFFHRELQALASSCAEVFLFSRHPCQFNEAFHFDIPHNVTVVNINTNQTWWSKTQTIFFTLSSGRWREVLRDFQGRNIKITWNRLKIILSYEEERIRMVDSIDKASKKLGKSTNSFIWYSYWCDESAYSLAYLKQFNRIDFAVCRTHSFDIYEERHPDGYLPFRQFIAKQLDFIWCISSHGQTYLQARFTTLRNKFTLHRLGVDNQHNLIPNPRNPFVIVTISNIFPVKNLETVIDALSMWGGQTVRWYHLGDGNDPHYVHSVHTKASDELRSNSRIEYHFLGFIAPELVIEKVKSLNPHVLVSASYFEGIPVSMMEASSLGIPIIGPSVCGVPEIVINQQNGYTFNPEYAEELFLHLQNIASMDEHDYQNLRNNALAVQQKYFNAKLNYEAITSCFAGQMHRNLSP